MGYGSLGGWDMFGPDRLITRSRGNVLYELDGTSALSLYRRYLGKYADDLPASGLLFPLSLAAYMAVGMADQIWVMVVAMIVSTVVMLISARPIGDFVEKHPTLKVLALAFLILIGVMLVAEGLGQHVSKGYIYFAMAFSLVVEMINMRVRKGGVPKEPKTF